ncbi:MAG: hypothetical protein QXO57_03850 [Candidatus Aenigmatarchaeota archaeon]
MNTNYVNLNSNTGKFIMAIDIKPKKYYEFTVISNKILYDSGKDMNYIFIEHQNKVKILYLEQRIEQLIKPFLNKPTNLYMYRYSKKSDEDIWLISEKPLDNYNAQNQTKPNRLEIKPGKFYEIKLLSQTPIRGFSKYGPFIFYRVLFNDIEYTLPVNEEFVNEINKINSPEWLRICKLNTKETKKWVIQPKKEPTMEIINFQNLTFDDDEEYENFQRGQVFDLGF